METTLIVIDGDAELARARALVDRLMESDRPEDWRGSRRKRV